MYCSKTNDVYKQCINTHSTNLIHQHNKMSQFINLRIHKINGVNLLPMDRNGASDPYIEVLHEGKLMHKTSVIKNTLNPVWIDGMSLDIKIPSSQLTLKVYEHAIQCIFSFKLVFNRYLPKIC